MKAPRPQREAKVLIVLFHSPMARGIEQTTDSNDRVDSESTHIAQAVMEFALQKVIDDGDWIIKVGEEIRDRAPHWCRRDLDVSARHGADHRVVNRAIECIYRSIDALEAITGIRFPGGQCGAAAKCECECECGERKSMELHKTFERSEPIEAAKTAGPDGYPACVGQRRDHSVDAGNRKAHRFCLNVRFADQVRQCVRFRTYVRPG